MAMEKFSDLYRGVGFTVVVKDKELILDIEGKKASVKIDSEWRQSIEAYYKAKQYSFDNSRRQLVSYKTVETALMRLDPAFPSRQEHEFVDTKGNKVRISPASHEYSLALMGANVEPNPMEFLKRRILRQIARRRIGSDGVVKLFKFEDIVVAPTTAKYSVPRKVNQDQLIDRGVKAIKSSLFKLAMSYGECWEFREAIPPRDSITPREWNEPDGAIPTAVYNDDLLKLYKVARSSLFPNQAFLSYYHILEYYFLRVSDEILHTSIKSFINSPLFSANYENVNKLISTLKKHDNSSDETEMLKAVLKKFVDEEEFIEHISGLDKITKKGTYTDTKKRIFGEQVCIKLEKTHALSSAARVLKHIRNALVHSSDKYNREDCFLPFSESENIVIDYIPIIRYLAERVIFATSESM